VTACASQNKVYLNEGQIQQNHWEKDRFC